MTAKKRRAAILESARAAAARGEHEIARFLFASLGISYVTVDEVRRAQEFS